MRKRTSGILLHITSLPSSFGVGDLGPCAYRFADFLAGARQGIWQVLPLGPTDPGLGNSPYSSPSAFAGNPLLISPELLVKDDLLNESDLRPLPDFPRQKVDYRLVRDYKMKLFYLAYERFKDTGDKSEYEKFCSQNRYWLDDFALFSCLKEHFGKRPWNSWPQDARNRDPKILTQLRQQLNYELEREKFLQYIFFKQWALLKGYCNSRKIQIMGDMPIYVNYDSACVWANPWMFKLGGKKELSFVAGVPPDYFSDTGQLWGNPVYDWRYLKKTGFSWWIKRMEHNAELFDLIRIDHFRGLVAYWEVPASEKTAVKGRWVKAPAEDFLTALVNRFPRFPIIAEDLGLITDDVREVMRRFGLPGMRVLLFAFGEDNPNHPYLPHNFVPDCVVYTGTHDNNTIKGWFENEATAQEKRRLFRYLGKKANTRNLHWELIRLAMMSPAKLIILPMQDILGLGQGARMNRPATSSGNWQWRLLERQLNPTLLRRLSEMTQTYGRAQDNEIKSQYPKLTGFGF
jgi:4-alpha-glucanotransferase